MPAGRKPPWYNSASRDSQRMHFPTAGILVLSLVYNSAALPTNEKAKVASALGHLKENGYEIFEPELISDFSGTSLAWGEDFSCSNLSLSTDQDLSGVPKAQLKFDKGNTTKINVVTSGGNIEINGDCTGSIKVLFRLSGEFKPVIKIKHIKANVTVELDEGDIKLGDCQLSTTIKIMELNGSGALGRLLDELDKIFDLSKIATSYISSNGCKLARQLLPDYKDSVVEILMA